MQSNELSITPGAQVSAGHVDVEDHIALVLSLADVIIWNADRQRPLLAVVHRCITDNKRKRIELQIIQQTR